MVRSNLPDQGRRLSVRKGFPVRIHKNDWQCSTQPWNSEVQQDQQPDEAGVDRNIRDMNDRQFHGLAGVRQRTTLWESYADGDLLWLDGR